MSKKIWLATFNKGKLKEFKNLFQSQDQNYEFLTASDLDFYAPPKETGSSFYENAMIKAKSFKAMVSPEDWVLAEDSGLEVEGLNHLPGVHSARYAGEKASDMQNNLKLLKMLDLKKVSNRTARYRCQIIALGPENKSIESEGACAGKIALKLSAGKNGFGYDPLFVPDGYEVTMADLSPSEKNKISHRTEATHKFLKALLKGC